MTVRATVPDSSRVAPPEGLGERAERLVHDRLRAALPPEYALYPDVTWILRDRGTDREGEADLVIAHPDRGFLAIEVKSGPISRDGLGRWWSGGRCVRSGCDDRARPCADVPGAGVVMLLEVGGTTCRDDQATPSATRVVGSPDRSAHGWGPPSFSRAHRSSRGPAEMDPKVPSAKTASSDKVRGDLPPPTAAMIAGHASSVDANRARTRFEGMSRSWYATAPSMKISVFSPGWRTLRFGTNSTFEKSISGMKNSSSGSSFVFTSFALRGAPCGNDPRPWAAFGRYHEQKLSSTRMTDHDEPFIVAMVKGIRPTTSAWIEIDGRALLERHPVLRPVDTRLLQVPDVPRHHGTVSTSPYPGLTEQPRSVSTSQSVIGSITSSPTAAIGSRRLIMEATDATDPEAPAARDDLAAELATLARSAATTADEARAQGLDPLTFRTLALDDGAGANLLQVAPLPGKHSFSSLSKYDKCPLQYAFSYVYRMPPREEPVAAMAFGSIAHEAFEAFTKDRRERIARGDPPPTREDLEREFRSRWAPSSFPDKVAEDGYQRKVANLLDNFWPGEVSSLSEALGQPWIDTG